VVASSVLFLITEQFSFFPYEFSATFGTVKKLGKRDGDKKIDDKKANFRAFAMS
jgi:hypothetical protein